jgi:hypothetical protein
MGWWWCNHCFKHTIEQHPCKLNRSFHRNMPPSLFLISYLRYIVSLPHAVTVLGTEKKRAAFVKISRKRWQEGRGCAQHHSDESRSRKAHAIDPISGATLVHSLPLRPLHRQITRQLYFFFSSLRQVFSSNASTLKGKALKFLLQIDLDANKYILGLCCLLPDRTCCCWHVVNVLLAEGQEALRGAEGGRSGSEHAGLRLVRARSWVLAPSFCWAGCTLLRVGWQVSSGGY